MCGSKTASHRTMVQPQRTSPEDTSIGKPPVLGRPRRKEGFRLAEGLRGRAVDGLRVGGRAHGVPRPDGLNARRLNQVHRHGGSRDQERVVILTAATQHVHQGAATRLGITQALRQSPPCTSCCGENDFACTHQVRCHGAYLLLMLRLCCMCCGVLPAAGEGSGHRLRTPPKAVAK